MVWDRIREYSQYSHSCQIYQVALLLFGAYITRLILFIQPKVIHTDGTQYATIGENVFAGNGYRGIYTGGAVDILSSPLYPILIGGVDLLLGDLALSAHLVSFLFGGAIVVPTYYLARRIYNNRIGLIAGLFVIFHPQLIRYSSEAVVESLYTFLLIATIYIGFRAYQEQSRVLYTLGGILLGLGFLTKPETVGYLGLFIVFSLIYQFFRDPSRELLIQRARYASYSTVSFLIVIAPFVYSLYQKTGEVTLGGKSGVNILLAEHVTSDDPYAYEKLAYGLTSEGDLRTTIWNETGASVLGYILNHPGEIVVRIALNLDTFYHSLFSNVIPPLFIGLAAIGIVSSKGSKSQLGYTASLAIVVAYPILSYSLFFARPRYLIPFVPIFLIWAAAGIPELGDLLNQYSETVKDRLDRQFIYSAAAGLVMLSLIFQSGFILTTANEPVEQRETSEWIEENTDEEAVVMARKPMVAFYAERTYWQLPYASYDEILSFARDRNVDYLIVTERDTEPNRPQLSMLFNESNDTPPGVELRHANTDGSEVYVYSIEYPSSQ